MASRLKLLMDTACPINHHYPAPGHASCRTKVSLAETLVCHVTMLVCHVTMLVCHVTTLVCHVTTLVCHVTMLVCHVTTLVCHVTTLVCHVTNITPQDMPHAATSSPHLLASRLNFWWIGHVQPATTIPTCQLRWTYLAFLCSSPHTNVTPQDMPHAAPSSPYQHTCNTLGHASCSPLLTIPT